MANLQGPHLIIILVVILLLFGAAKLPALAKSLGQSARVFKGEMKAMKSEETDDAANGATPQASATPTTSSQVSQVADVPVPEHPAKP